MKTFQTGLLVLSLVLMPAAGAISASLRGGAQDEATYTRNENDATETEAESTSLGTAWNFARRVAGRMAGRLTGQKQQQPATPAEEATEGGSGSYMFRMILQLVFALIYYQVIVAQYPRLDKPVISPEAQQLQSMDAVSACCHPSMSFPNAMLSVFCTGPRAAHTFHAVGVMNYWLGCCLMTCFPCCTLFYTNAFTDLNERLGGDRQNCIMACLCSFCCSNCLVAQDAQSLDMVSGTRTGFCYLI